MNASAPAQPDQTDAASTLPSQHLTVEALRQPLESAPDAPPWICPRVYAAADRALRVAFGGDTPAPDAVHPAFGLMRALAH